MPDHDTVSARPDRLRSFRVTAGEIADGLLVRRAALLDAVHDYEAATEPAYRAPARAVRGDVREAILVVRELGAFVGAVGDAFGSIAGDVVVTTSPSSVDDALPVGFGGNRALVAGFGTDLLEQWDASEGEPWLERAGRSVLDAGIETALTVAGGALGGVAAVAVCRGAASCHPGGVLLGQRAGHWVGERLTELVGLGDEPDPEPGEHRRHEVRDDVAELDDDEEDLVDASVGESLRPGLGW